MEEHGISGVSWSLPPMVDEYRPQYRSTSPGLDDMGNASSLAIPKRLENTVIRDYFMPEIAKPQEGAGEMLDEARKRIFDTNSSSSIEPPGIENRVPDILPPLRIAFTSMSVSSSPGKPISPVSPNRDMTQATQEDPTKFAEELKQALQSTEEITAKPRHAWEEKKIKDLETASLSDPAPEKSTAKRSTSSLPTPILQHFLSTPDDGEETTRRILAHPPPTNANASSAGNEQGDLIPGTARYVDEKPTCLLNLICYRSGVQGCQIKRIYVADPRRFQRTRDNESRFIFGDKEFFQTLRDVYNHKMCSIWRRVLFLKTLSYIRLLSVSAYILATCLLDKMITELAQKFTPTTRPTVFPLDDFIIQEILYAYQNPSTIETEHDWIDWVFRLRQPDRRHALEFVEGWNGTRIAIAGLMPLMLSCILGIVWSWKTSDVQTAFTVAGFVLTAGTLVLALLAIISGIEASGRAST